MNKFLGIFIFLIFFACNLSVQFAFAEEKQTVLTGSVSMVPYTFYGTWRVKSSLNDTDSPYIFKKSGIDIWNLSRVNDVIILSNPFSGARAEIKIDKADNDVVVFKKTGKYGTKLLTDIVEIKLKGDSFTGVDKIQLDTFVSGKIMKTEKAIYNLNGEKIVGDVK